MKGLSRRRKRHFESAGAHRQHTDGSGGWRVAVRAQQSFAWLTKSLLVYRVANAVTGGTKRRNAGRRYAEKGDRQGS
jgi:hypothetical protein